VSAIATPKRGSLAPPDTVVGRGTVVQLRARAYMETISVNCSVAFTPLPNPRWTLTFQPLGSDSALDVTSQLGTSQAFIASFTADGIGSYRATFQVDSPPNTTIFPIPILIEVTDAPIGWVNLGPDGTRPNGRLTSTGRIDALAAAPQGGVLYAGSAYGGVWKTMNTGASWSPMSDNKTLSPIAIGTLAVASDGTLYAGTGDPFNGPSGRGVFVWSDGGLSWANKRRCLPAARDPAFRYGLSYPGRPRQPGVRLHGRRYGRAAA
jgi:hypothetical protein